LTRKSWKVVLGWDGELFMEASFLGRGAGAAWREKRGACSRGTGVIGGQVLPGAASFLLLSRSGRTVDVVDLAGQLQGPAVTCISPQMLVLFQLKLPASSLWRSCQLNFQRQASSPSGDDAPMPPKAGAIRLAGPHPSQGWRTSRGSWCTCSR
jgi:hypothetical protein